MGAEFDIFGGFIDDKALTAFEDLEKQAKKTAESMAKIAAEKDKIFGSVNQGGGVSKTQEKLAADLQRANEKMKQLQEQHAAKMLEIENRLNAKIQEQKDRHERKILEQERKFNDQRVIDAQRTQDRLDQIERNAENRRNEYDRRRNDALNDRAQREAQRQQEAANRAAQQAQNAAQRAANNTPEARVDRNALNTISKLQATLVSQYTTQLQKLDAQIKLNIIDAQKYVTANDTQNQAYLDLMKNTKQLSEEYDRLAKASGATEQKTNSMYGATYSLTQVMRELPNFAIDARVGFMSLSNNLPMLWDDFSRLSEEIDTVTGKKKGFSGALKEFGKSLLSMNTILIVASTLLVLYGEDIMDVIVNLKSAETAADKFYKTVKDGYTDVYKKMADDVSKIIQFSLDYYSARRKGDKEVIKSLEERGIKEFGLHQKQLDMISENVNNWRSAFEVYLQMAKITYDNEFRIKAGAEQEWIIKRERANQKLIEQRVREAAKQSGADDTGAESEVQRLRAGKMGKLELTYWKETKDWTESIKAETKAIEELKVLKQISVTALVPRLKPEKDKPDSKKAQKQFTEINVMREYYESESTIIKKLADLQNDITKENEEGVLNSYDKRKKASELYYKTIENLAIQERFVAIQNEKIKTDAAKRTIQQKYENNVRKFGKNSKEAIQSAGELSVGNATLEANERDAILKINDDFTKKILSATKKRTSDLYAINKDMYDDEVYLIQQKEKIQLMFAGQEQTSGVEMALGLFGVKKDKSFENGNRERDIKRQSLLSQLTGASGDQEKDIWRSLKELDQEDINQQELMNLQMVEDAKASIVENSVETLKSLWDSYYQYLQDKVDEELKTQTKANDERIKQYEDETEAGIHTTEELKEFKENATTYQTALDEEAARKKKELEKEQFLLTQAFATGQVWINYAINASKEGVNAITQAWLLGSAIAQTALIAAQTIPAFEKGGDVTESGISLVGEKRHELVYDKKTGKSFITPDTPTLMYLTDTMKVYPDINKLDLDSFNLMNHGLPMIQQDDRLLDKIDNLTRVMSKQKPQPINGLRLMQQLQYNQKIISNRKSLVN